MPKKAAAALTKAAPTKRGKPSPLPQEIFKGDYKFFPHEDPHKERLQELRDHCRISGDPSGDGDGDDGRSIRSVLYAGSWIHITSSLVFPKAVYVDNFTGRGNLLKSFFDDPRLMPYVNDHKAYENADGEDEISIHLLQQDYHDNFPKKISEEHPKFDLLVSLDAGGDISAACARHIRTGGYLYVNDGHGDACTAFGNPKIWKLCGFYSDFDTKLQTDDLAKYFVHAKKRQNGRRLTPEEALMNTGKGYSKRPHKFREDADVYVFQKL